MDNAQALYERLLKNGKSELDTLISENAAEHYFLDFKRKSDSDGNSPLGESDDKNLGKALSGFANAQGGIIIWGIEKKEKQKRPMQYVLIKNPQFFTESLNRRISETATPLVEGVDSRVIFEQNGEGVVATYIPESEKTPHRNLIDHHYYTKSGDTFRRLEHFSLEDMFGRRSRPKLSLNILAKLYSDSRPHPTYNLHLGITNYGKAISQNYGFDLEFPTKIIANSYLPTNRPNFITHSDTSQIGMIKYRNTHDEHKVPLFPSETINLSPNSYYLNHIQIIIAQNQLDAWKYTPLKYKIYSENMQTEEGQILFGDLFKN